MKRAMKVLKIVGNVILWLFVAFAVLVTILVFSAQSDSHSLPSIGGKSLITVSSDSMRPTFKQGDLIVDEVLTAKEQRECKVGEIITFYANLDGEGNDEINTHRIVEVYEDAEKIYYMTQGDNPETNKYADENPVVATKVLGKYTGTRIPLAGGIITFLQTSMGFLCCIVIPLVVFFLFELYRFIITIVRVKGKKKISAEDEEEIKKRAIEEYLQQQKDGAAEKKEETPESVE